MASVEKRGEKWSVRWRTPDGKMQRRTFDRKTDARRHAAEVEASLNRGEYVDLRDRTTVRQAAEAWVETRAIRATTRSRYQSTVRNHVAATPLGSRRLSDVRVSDVQGWVADRSKLLAPSTLAQAYGVLTYVFAAAVRDRRLVRNPCTGVVLPRSQAPRLVPLTVQEVQALAAAVPPRMQALVLLIAGCGLRHGEALGLRVADVDFLRRVIRVETQFSAHERARADTKTPRSIRTVPLPAPVADALSAHLAQFGTGEDGVVFSSEVGTYYHQESITRAMKGAVQKLGLPPKTTPHSLRHHYASLLLLMGESVFVVAERLGDTVSTVSKTYGHVMPGHEDRTRQAIEEAWRAHGVPTGTATAL